MQTYNYSHAFSLFQVKYKQCSMYMYYHQTNHLTFSQEKGARAQLLFGASYTQTDTDTDTDTTPAMSICLFHVDMASRSEFLGPFLCCLRVCVYIYIDAKCMPFHVDMIPSYPASMCVCWMLHGHLTIKQHKHRDSNTDAHRMARSSIHA